MITAADHLTRHVIVPSIIVEIVLLGVQIPKAPRVWQTKTKLISFKARETRDDDNTDR